MNQNGKRKKGIEGAEEKEERGIEGLEWNEERGKRKRGSKLKEGGGKKKGGKRNIERRREGWKGNRACPTARLPDCLTASLPCCLTS